MAGTETSPVILIGRLPASVVLRAVFVAIPRASSGKGRFALVLRRGRQRVHRRRAGRRRRRGHLLQRRLVCGARGCHRRRHWRWRHAACSNTRGTHARGSRIRPCRALSAHPMRGERGEHRGREHVCMRE